MSDCDTGLHDWQYEPGIPDRWYCTDCDVKIVADDVPGVARWAVHVVGPDDLLPMPNRDAAEFYAGKLNGFFTEYAKGKGEHWPTMRADVIAQSAAVAGPPGEADQAACRGHRAGDECGRCGVGP